MDEEERKSKIQAGKAKLASFRKKKGHKSHKKSKHDKSDDTSKSLLGAGDSTAVQTGDDNSSRDLSDVDDLSTTADEMSTEEEMSANILSPRERMQELELTISDQQIALQKLTMENKTLHEHELHMESVISERNEVIGTLQKNVEMTAQHVKQLQENLFDATQAVKVSGGEQGQIVAELIKTRAQLTQFQQEVNQQEEAMKEIARKLEEKSMEAAEAQIKCKSLMSELEITQSAATDSKQATSDIIQSLKSEHEKEINSLRVEVDEVHGQQLAFIKKEHEEIRRKLEEKHKEELSRLRSDESMDAADVRALQEQVEQLNIQLEASYREAEKSRKKHDNEVVKLNQQLINCIDEYETKVQNEKNLVIELENKLDMSDTVNSEIQASFSLQMQQLEEERDRLRDQLLEEGSKSKELASLNNVIQDLRDELETYKDDVKATEKQLEETSSQKRKLNDELRKTQDDLKKETRGILILQEKLNSSSVEINELKEKIKEKEDEVKAAYDKNANDKQEMEEEYKLKVVSCLEEQRATLEAEHNAAVSELNAQLEDNITKCRSVHAEEMKTLHSQHMQQMDEMRKEMETQLTGMRETLEAERKLQVSAVKDVHEKSRDREIMDIKDFHSKEIDNLNKNHNDALHKLKLQLEEDNKINEAKLKRELEEDFDDKISQLKSEHEINLQKSLTELTDKLKSEHKEEKRQKSEEIATDIKEKYELLLAEEKAIFETQLQQKLDEMESCQKNYEEEKINIINEHQTLLQSLKDEHDAKLLEHEDETRRLLDEARQEHEAAIQLIKQEADDREATEKHVQQQFESLQKQMTEGTSKLDAEYKQSLSAKEEEFNHLRNRLEEEVQNLSNKLKTLESERDEILAQAEESRKRLETLHHDEMLAMQQQLDAAIADHHSRIRQMQNDIESSRASRNELQELKNQLLTRNTTVEELEEMENRFQLEKTSLQADFERQMQELRDEYTTIMEQTRLDVPEDVREEMVQLKHQVEEYREKLSIAETTLATVRASSPARPPSSASDYDTSKLDAMNKDYRDAMTLTHISDVSGLGDLEEGVLHTTTDDDGETNQEEIMEEGELHSMEEGELGDDVLSPEKTELEDIPKGKSSPQREENVRLMGEVEDLLEKVKKLEMEFESLSHSHSVQMDNLIENHKLELEDLKNSISEKHKFELEHLKNHHEKELGAMEIKNTEKLQELENEKLKEITQIRLQCASETAQEIEKETELLTEKLQATHKEEMESLKLELDKQYSEKMDETQKNHVKALEELTERNSASMEERLSAVMQELYNQKQQAAKESEIAHKKQLEEVKEEHLKAEESLVQEWKKKVEDLEQNNKSLTSDIEKLRSDYDALQTGLQSGDIDEIKILKQQYEDDVTRLRQTLEESYQKKLEDIQSEEAEQFEKAQEDYLNQHQKQLDDFVTSHRGEVEALQREKEEVIRKISGEHRTQVEELESKLQAVLQKSSSEKTKEFDEEKSKLLEEHNEEEELSSQIESLIKEHETNLTNLKSNLIAQHMEKFQGTIAELDQHHINEIEKLKEEHDKENEQYKTVAEESIEKMKRMESSNAESLKSALERHEAIVSQLKEEQEAALQLKQEEHENEINSLKNQHAEEMELIEKEILSNEEKHKNDLESVLLSQTAQLDEIKNQFEGVLSSTQESANEKTAELIENVGKLEEQLDAVQEELKIASNALEEQQLKFSMCEKQLEDVTTSYEDKLAKVSTSLESSYDELKDLNARVEFERAEYEAEIDQLQSEVKRMEDNEKKLHQELDKRSVSLDQMTSEYETVSERHDRETQEEDNLIKMLREDIEKLKKEKEQLLAANERILSPLSDLVNANNKCEDLIARRLKALPIGGTKDSAEASASAALDPFQEEPSAKLATSGGSFVDEGLEVSQRLSESLFAGPDLDSSTLDVVADSGSRVIQAVRRLLDMLDTNIQQLNMAQQAQIMLGAELQKSENQKMEREKQETMTKEELIDQIEQMEKVIDGSSSKFAELEFQLQEKEEMIEEASKKICELEEKMQDQMLDEEKLHEDQKLLQKEREALVENSSEAEKNLLKIVDELTSAKHDLSEQLQGAKSKYENDIHQLELGLESAIHQLENREKEHAAQEADLNEQIEVLQKQVDSQSKFSNEQTKERESERDEFQEELSRLQDELNKKQDFHRSDSNMMQELEGKPESEVVEKDDSSKISKLEEELVTKEQAYHDQLEKIKEEENILKMRMKEQEEALAADQEEMEQTRNEVETITREKEALRQELYDTMMKVSLLEGKLDRYRLGDRDSDGVVETGAGDQTRHIERLKLSLEQNVEELESKDNEIERLVEIHSQLQSEILEKEEQIEKLLSELDSTKTLEAECAQMKEKLEVITRATSEETLPTRPEQLSALSQHLLDEKNIEIDELNEKINELKEQLEEIPNQSNIIEDLKKQLEEANIKLNAKDALKSMEGEISDLSNTDDSSARNKILEELQIQNKDLQTKINELMSSVSEGDISLPVGTKEKIRDLEEHLMKEVDTNDVEPNSRVVGKDLILTHNNQHTYSPNKSKESNLIKEKLSEITKELKEIPNNVIGRILREQDECLVEKEEEIAGMEDKMSLQKDQILQLQNEVSDLKKEIAEPDVNIRMNDKNNDGELPTIEKVESVASSSSGTVDHEFESPPLTPDSNQDEDLNTLLQKKEEEISKQAEIIAKQSEAIEAQESEKESIAAELKLSVQKCEEMQIELEQRLNELSETETPVGEMTPQELIQFENVRSVIQQATEHLEAEISGKEREIAATKEEKERLSSDLRDIQREYMSLLKESDAFESANQVKSQLEEKINELEELLQEREAELQQSQQDADDLLQEKNSLAEQIRELEKLVTKDDEDSPREEHNETIIQLRSEVDSKDQLIEDMTIKLQNANQGLEDKMKSASEDIELLQNEQQILVAENNSLQNKLNDLKTANNELQTTTADKEAEIVNLKMSLNELSKRFETEVKEHQGPIKQNEEAQIIKPVFVTESKLQTNAPSSTTSEESVSNEDLIQEHHKAMALLKEKYSSEITQAVDACRKELSAEHEKKLNAIQQQHRMEVAELLSESTGGESELAQRLRAELDLADRLDNKLVGHLQYSNGENMTDAEVSVKLQDLLDRVHREGIEVLSLSELQFIRQQQLKNASTATPTKTRRLQEDMAQKEEAWECEKAALINAMQALKELLTQVNEQPSEEEESKCRGDLLQSLSDFFASERDVLLAELRTSVIDAQNSVRDDLDAGEVPEEATTKALEKLEKLQEKIQQQSVSHQETLDKMKSADRDALLSEVYDLREDRKSTITQTEERIKHLEDLLNNKDNEITNLSHDAQSQVDQLQSKLQQEHTMLEEALDALQSEKKRNNEQLSPALDRERERVSSLEKEIADLQNKLAEEAATAVARNKKLLTELDDNRMHMDDLQGEVTSLRKKLDEAEAEMKNARREIDQIQEQSHHDITDLRNRIQTADNLHKRAVEAFEMEKTAAENLRNELSTERADYLKESSQEKAKFEKLSSEAETNKQRIEHLASALSHEQSRMAAMQAELDQQKQDALNTRTKDRATIAELHNILDQAKTDSDALQQKLRLAERDAKTTSLELEAVKRDHKNEMEAEHVIRAQLETTLNELQSQKEETERKLDELERDVLNLQNKSKSLPQLSPEQVEELLSHRRQLEAIRQRLQLEGSKLQDLIGKTACHVPYNDPTDSARSPQDELESDSEQVDSIKRTLGGMQQELRELYADMTMPDQSINRSKLPQNQLNDKLLQQNAELTQAAISASDERLALRDVIRKLENNLWALKHEQPPSRQEQEIKNKQQQMQEMANRMHRLYTRYMRAESFRKALVYQKKYMLMLIGGFQDCEETTLALIARMGAFPTDLNTSRSRHSRPFTRFRSAVRVVMAVSRLKFLVRKWERHSQSVSDAILGKHGTAPIVNGHKISQHTSPSGNHLRPASTGYLPDRSPSPSSLPQTRNNSYVNGYSNPMTNIAFTPPVKLSQPASSYRRSGVIPDASIPSQNNIYPSTSDHSSGRQERSQTSPSSYYPNYSRSSYNRSNDRPIESDPSLNAYIQRLENLQHRLNQDPHRYPR